ncbi:probable glutathione S-transferase [Neltuma alba]|uniref:probable glutathione S-transferase n=1 Tax=Neltuma alba TaxID=207710 RepID=UPI0010A3EB45|nr:probable glutathione S-transferase [Prosopis alba]
MAAKEEQVKFLGKWPSPFSNRVDLALKLKGIKYDYSEEDLSNKSQELLTSNPVHKKVPVLIHNGRPISESLVIVEYIDETWKSNPFLPPNPYHRASARFWSKLVDEKCLPPLWDAFWCEEKGREKAVEEAMEALKILENEIGDKRFFGGDDVGLVDISANFVGYWVDILQEIAGLQLLTSEKFPKLYKWSQEFSTHPIVKQALPPRDKLFAFFKSRTG